MDDTTPPETPAATDIAPPIPADTQVPRPNDTRTVVLSCAVPHDIGTAVHARATAAGMSTAAWLAARVIGAIERARPVAADTKAAALAARTTAAAPTPEDPDATVRGDVVLPSTEAPSRAARSRTATKAGPRTGRARKTRDGHGL